MYECCKSLGLQVGNPIDKNIIEPTSFDSLLNETKRITYLKIRNYSAGKLSFSTVQYDDKVISETVKERIKSIEKPDNINSTEALVDYLSKIAEMTFLKDGFHIQTLIFYNKDFQPIDLLNTTFEDQSDKYIFWRYAADRAKMINAYGFIWISELWIRLPKSHLGEAIHKMPIIDEKLQIIGIDANNNQKSISWKIIRENDDSKPTLETFEIDSKNAGKPYFMRSVLKAIGGDINMLND